MSHIVRHQALQAFVARVFTRLGVPGAEAQAAAEIAVAADLRGVDSHGVEMLPRKADYIRRGLIEPAAQVRVDRETPATALLDGGNGLGEVASKQAMERCIQKAKAAGAGFVAVRDSNHYGIAGYYAVMALEHDMIGVSMTNTTPITVPTFGRKAMLGTNPISVAAPAGSFHPFVLDMATSIVPSGNEKEFETEAERRRTGIPLHDQVVANLSDNHPTEILRYLDIGALGVQIPMVKTADDARRAVEAVKHQPLGQRGMGGARVSAWGMQGGFVQYAQDANRETMVVIQIETKEAVDNISSILSVEGVDAVLIGRLDLSQALGILGKTQEPMIAGIVIKSSQRRPAAESRWACLNWTRTAPSTTRAAGCSCSRRGSVTSWPKPPPVTCSRCAARSPSRFAREQCRPVNVRVFRNANTVAYGRGALAHLKTEQPHGARLNRTERDGEVRRAGSCSIFPNYRQRIHTVQRCIIGPVTLKPSNSLNAGRLVRRWLLTHPAHVARAVAALLVLIAVAPPPPLVILGPAKTVQTRHPIVCAHTRLTDEVEEWKIQRTLALVREMGAPWIVEYFPWAYVEPAPGVWDWRHADLVIKHAENQGLTVIARLGLVPEWARERDDDQPTTDTYLEEDRFDEFGDYVFEFVKRYRGRVRYVIIWNEPNITLEWGYRPVDPAGYTALLKLAYARAKEADPEIRVLGGALAPTLEPIGSPFGMNDLDYLQKMYDAGAAPYFDILALHAYGLVFPPDDPPAPDVINYRRVELIREIMIANGDGGKMAMITESGWNDSPRWTKAVKPAARIDYTLGSYEWAETRWPWVQAACTWAFRFPAPQHSYGDYYAFVTPDFIERPVYKAVKGWAAP